MLATKNKHSFRSLLFVVRYSDELAVLTKLFDHLGELAYFGIIQWCIHLVQNTEWRRLDKIDGKH